MKRIIYILCVLVVFTSCSKPPQFVPWEDPEVPENPDDGTDDPYEGARQLYVSPSGDDSNSGEKRSAPIKSFSKAVELSRPGDVINFLPGNYYLPDQNTGVTIDKSGTEEKCIVYRAEDEDNRPVINFGGNKSWNAVRITGSYITLDGLEFKGIGSQLDTATAISLTDKYLDSGKTEGFNELPIYNTNCMSIGMDGKPVTHHVTVRNCIIHDSPAGGIGASNCDYITIEDNLIHNNCWFTMYATSGISFVYPKDIDGNKGYKIVISGNTVFNNGTSCRWHQTKAPSDGNGIILDINGSGSPYGEYQGRTLVCNNVSYFNGGSGIHAFCANHVDIINNTAYHNGRKYKDTTNNYPDIDSHAGTDCNIINNIISSYDNVSCNGAVNADVNQENNLTFGGKAASHNGHKVADPLFVNATFTLEADFHLRAGSPAVGMGVRKGYMPEVDKDGRSREGKLDVGAYISE